MTSSVNDMITMYVVPVSAGRDWWYGFLKRHPTLSRRLPESLQSCRASSCTPERLDKWYKDYAEFIEKHGLKDKPQCIWNADESGFPLCPKTTRVLAMKNKKHVYSVNADTKTQITTLVAANAAGSVIPPMHVYPGKRFHYNPLEGGVAGAYFGKSDSGWMKTELFYGWIANHFVAHIPPERPVVLLVDGHTTHIDLEISRFCKENGILLYCLLAHSSHLTQPLDVGFFGALKSSWAKAVDKHKIAHMGSSVTKESFAAVFNTAWTGAVKMSTIVNSYARAGIFPVNRNAVGNSGPAALYSESSTSTTDSSSYESSSSKTSTKSSSTSQASSSLDLLETMMSPSVIAKFNERFNEGYNVSGDELYSMWERFKKLSVSTPPQTDTDTSSQVSAAQPGPSQAGPSQSNTAGAPRVNTATQPQFTTDKPAKSFTDILVYPEPISKKTKSKDPMPSHLNSSQFMEYLQQKQQQKIDLEEEKCRKRAEKEAKKVEREAKKAELEEQKRQKKVAREAKKAKELAEKQRKKDAKKKKTSTRATAKKTSKRTKAATRKATPSDEEHSFAESESSSTDDNEASDDLETCPVCHEKEGDTSGQWVACDNCSQWYHVECTLISEADYGKISSLTWVCDPCTMLGF